MNNMNTINQNENFYFNLDNTINLEQLNEEINKILNPHGYGTFYLEDQHCSFLHPFFFTYYMKGLDKILSLRVQNSDIESKSHIKILQAQSIKNIEEICNIMVKNIDIINNEKFVLIPILINHHWAGFIIKKDSDDLITMTYIDSENSALSLDTEAISKYCSLLLRKSVKLQQMTVEQQKYNNCGVELVENFMLYLTGNRLTQEESVAFHSMLVEEDLIQSKGKSDNSDYG